MRVLVVSDSEFLTFGVCAALAQGGIAHTDRARTLEDALDLIAGHGPDVVFVNLDFGNRQGLKLIDALMEATPTPTIVMVSSTQNPYAASLGFKKGARGYVALNDDPRCLLEAVEKVKTGQLYFSPQAAHELVIFDIEEYRNPRNPAVLLSQWQLQVFLLIAQGHTHVTAAESLGATPKATAAAVYTIKKKLRAEKKEFFGLARKYWLLPDSAESGPLRALGGK